MSKADMVVEIVNDMRKNGEEMRLWKNVELPRECMSLLESLDEEPAAVKARV